MTKEPSTVDHVQRVIAAIGNGGKVDASATSPPPVDLEARAREEHDRIREGRRERLRKAWQTVPPSFQWAKFGDEQLRERVRPMTIRGKECDATQVMFDPEEVPSLLLIGPSQSGKTSIAAACLRFIIGAASKRVDAGAGDRIYRQGLGVRFVTAYDLAKAQIYSRLGSRPELVNQSISASVLVIDELGMDVDVYRQSATSVREVIHERHSHHRPTIITTYLSKTQLRQHYGDGIANRLGTYRVVRLGGLKK